MTRAVAQPVIGNGARQGASALHTGGTAKASPRVALPQLRASRHLGGGDERSRRREAGGSGERQQ